MIFTEFTISSFYYNIKCIQTTACPKRMTVTSVSHIYPSCLSVSQVCPSRLSVMSVHHICQSHLSIKFAHHSVLELTICKNSTHFMSLFALQKSANKSANIRTFHPHSLLKCQQLIALQFCTMRVGCRDKCESNTSKRRVWKICCHIRGEVLSSSALNK